MNSNMNKKIVIGVAVALSLLIILVLSAVYNSSRETVKNSEDFGKLTDSGYYVQNGIETQAEVAKNATEAYLKQDREESIDERDVRLSKYFSKESDVYGQKVEVDQLSKVTSVISCELQESGWCLSIFADSTTDSGIKVTRKYWVTLEKQADNSFRVVHIGVWE